MRIMLIQDVASLGRVGDVVEVKNGYARNFLIPQKMAVVATAGAIKQAEQLRSAAYMRRARERSAAEAQAARYNALETLRFERKVGESGRLYGSVTSGDIAERLSELSGEEVDRRKVLLHEPIKMLGDFEVALEILADVTATVNVTVVGENGETAEMFADVEEAPSPFEALAEGEPQPEADY